MEQDYKSGRLILAARYTTSNAIHQMSKLPREKWDGYLSWLENFEYDLLELPRPNAVAFLDMPPDVSQRLIVGRYRGQGASGHSREDTAYLIRCREAALYAAEKLLERYPLRKRRRPLPEKEISQILTGIVEEYV